MQRKLPFDCVSQIFMQIINPRMNATVRNASCTGQWWCNILKIPTLKTPVHCWVWVKTLQWLKTAKFCTIPTFMYFFPAFFFWHCFCALFQYFFRTFLQHFSWTYHFKMGGFSQGRGGGAFVWTFFSCVWSRGLCWELIILCIEGRSPLSLLLVRLARGLVHLQRVLCSNTRVEFSEVNCIKHQAFLVFEVNWYRFAWYRSGDIKR